MKKGILLTTIGIIVLGVIYFGIEMYGFAKGVKEDSQKQIGIKKTKLSKYENTELLMFYKDFEKEITEIIWTDEPPAKLSGVILVISKNKYYEINLDSIPELYRMNLDRNWKMSEVGNSKIQNIKLIEK